MRNTKNEIVFRKANIPLIVLVLGIAVFLFAGCPLDEDDNGITMEQRVSRLENDLNNDYTRVYRNWHSTTDTYGLGAESSWVQTHFGPTSERNFEFNIISTNESTNTISATLTSTNAFNNTGATFTFRKAGNDWMIEVLELANRELDLNALVLD